VTEERRNGEISALRRGQQPWELRVSALMVFQFAAFTLDVARNRLQSGGRPIELRPKTFDLLRYFVENPDRALRKDELMSAIWPNLFVTDDSLKRCVSELRQALGDDTQQIIKTLPRRGYLFAAPVVRAGTRNATAELVAPERPSVAVLPFANMSSDPDQDYFSDGISEDLTTMLSKFGELLVIARNSAFQYKGRFVDVKQIGRELGVRYLLEGSVRRDAKRVRITAQLIETAQAKHLWAETYDRELAEVFTLQDEVARKIIVTLVAHISRSEVARALRKPETLAVYDLYLRGRQMMKNIQNATWGETIAAARTLYERSIALDTAFAPAYCALADNFVASWFHPTSNGPISAEFHDPDTLERAFALAHRAVELDGNFAEGHATLAWILHWQYCRSDSLVAFERAFARNPNFLEGSYRYGIALIHHGRTQEGIDFLQSIVRLDPFHSAFYDSCLGTGYYLQGRYEEALELLRIATRRVKANRIFGAWHAAAAAQMKQYREAADTLADLRVVDPGFTISRWLDFLRLASSDDERRTADGLRKAGLPE
jgi:adenylate cyclase